MPQGPWPLHPVPSRRGPPRHGQHFQPILGETSTHYSPVPLESLRPLHLPLRSFSTTFTHIFAPILAVLELSFNRDQPLAPLCSDVESRPVWKPGAIAESIFEPVRRPDADLWPLAWVLGISDWVASLYLLVIGYLTGPSAPSFNSKNPANMPNEPLKAEVSRHVLTTSSANQHLNPPLIHLTSAQTDLKMHESRLARWMWKRDLFQSVSGKSSSLHPWELLHSRDLDYFRRGQVSLQVAVSAC